MKLDVEYQAKETIKQHGVSLMIIVLITNKNVGL